MGCRSMNTVLMNAEGRFKGIQQRGRSNRMKFDWQTFKFADNL